MSNIYSEEEYIPESTFEKIDISKPDNEYSKHVSIKAIERAEMSHSKDFYSPKRYFSFEKVEKYIDGKGYSTELEIISPNKGMNTKLIFNNHLSDGVSATWVNDKYIMIDVWIGRIACVQFILDCEQRSIITCDMEYYGGQIYRQEKAESEKAEKAEKTNK